MSGSRIGYKDPNVEYVDLIGSEQWCTVVLNLSLIKFHSQYHTRYVTDESRCNRTYSKVYCIFIYEILKSTDPSKYSNTNMNTAYCIIYEASYTSNRKSNNVFQYKETLHKNI